MQITPLNARASQIKAENDAQYQTEGLIIEALKITKTSQKELSRMTGISYRTLTRMLHGQGDISIRELSGMMDRLGFRLNIQAVPKE